MKNNLFFALLANIVNAAFSWLLLLYLVRFGTKQDVGLLALAQAMALPIHMFFTLKMRTLQATDFAKEFSDEDYISARLVLAGVNIVFLSVLSLMIYWGEFQYIYAVIAFGISYSLAIVREYYISVMQQAARNDGLFISNLVQGILGIVVFVAIYQITKGVAEAILGLALSRIPAMVLDDVICSRFTSIGVVDGFKCILSRWVNIKKLIIKSYPLGLVAIMMALSSSIPRYFLEIFSGLEQLGVYATIMSLVVVLNIFANSFGQAILPEMARMYGGDLKAFMSGVKKGAGSVLVALVMFMIFVDIFSVEILYYAFGLEYVSYTQELYWSMVSGCALVLFHLGNLLLNAQKNYGVQVYIYGGCVIITAVFSIILIDEYEVMGAIAATILCSLMGFIFSIFSFWTYRAKSEY